MAGFAVGGVTLLGSATRQLVCQNITSLTLARLMSQPLNTPPVILVSITAETPCNNKSVGNAEKSTWTSYTTSGHLDWPQCYQLQSQAAHY
jgi:hypothetical protein